MDAHYHVFQRVDVVVDTNADNVYLDRLREFARVNLTRRVRLRVHATDVMDRSQPWAPLNLSWQHRSDMASRLEEYDWFMYTEEGALQDLGPPSSKVWMLHVCTEACMHRGPGESACPVTAQ